MAAVSLMLALGLMPRSTLGRPSLTENRMTFMERAGNSTSAEPSSASESSNPKTSPVNVHKNLPIQLLIVIACVVLTATFAASLAWLFRSKGKGPWQRRKKPGMQRRNAWSPGNMGSIYTFGSDSDSIKDKSDLANSSGVDGTNSSHGRNGKSSLLSPISPIPPLKKERSTHFDGTLPPQAYANPQTASKPVRRGNGWQLFDGPATHDVEAACAPPARRPSFIDKLLAHRAVSSVECPSPAKNAASELPLNTPQLQHGHGAHISQKVPGTPLALTPGAPQPPATPGGTFLSALNAPIIALRRVSQQRNHFTREQAPSPRFLPIESDFEGTIGEKDAELPMACRTRTRQPMYEDSTVSPPVNQVYTPFHAVGTPYTPGVAGIGTTWGRASDAYSIPSQMDEPQNQLTVFDDLRRRHKWEEENSTSKDRRSRRATKINEWVVANQLWDVGPPPDSMSRRGSEASLALTTNDFVSVSRQASLMNNQTRQTQTPSHAFPQALLTSLLKQHSPPPIRRSNSILIEGRTPITEVASWLQSDRTIKPSSSVVEPPVSTEDEKHSILDKYLSLDVTPVPNLKRTATIASTNYDSGRGTMLWDEKPPSYRTEPSSNESEKQDVQADAMNFPKRAESAGQEEFLQEKLQRKQLRAEKRARKEDRRRRKEAKQSLLREAQQTNIKSTRKRELVTLAEETSGESTKAEEQNRRHRALDKSDSVKENGKVARSTNEPDFASTFVHRPSLAESQLQFRSPFLFTAQQAKRSQSSSVLPTEEPKASRAVQPTKIPSQVRCFSSSATQPRPRPRPLSPPESPLTSASEAVLSPQYASSRTGPLRQTSNQNGKQAGSRPFLVEARRHSIQQKP